MAELRSNEVLAKVNQKIQKLQDQVDNLEITSGAGEMNVIDEVSLKLPGNSEFQRVLPKDKKVHLDLSSMGGLYYVSGELENNTWVGECNAITSLTTGLTIFFTTPAVPKGDDKKINVNLKIGNSVAGVYKRGSQLTLDSYPEDTTLVLLYDVVNKLTGKGWMVIDDDLTDSSEALSQDEIDTIFKTEE